MATVARPTLPSADARAVLAHASDDQLLHAGLALLLLVGLRPAEVEGLRVRDYEPEARRLRVGTDRHPRTVRIAAAAAATLDAYLATQDTDPGDYLLPELRTTRLVQLVRRTAEAAGVTAGVHDLRRAAVAAVLEDGTPVRQVEAYFGVSRAPGVKDLVPLPEGYDTGVADVLEAAFVDSTG